MVDAIPSLLDPKTIEMFKRQRVFSKAELESRAEIHYEAYSKAVNIEAKTMEEMVSRQYIPAVIRYTTELATSLNAVRQAWAQADVSVQTELLEQVSALLAETKQALRDLQQAEREANAKPEGAEMAIAFKESVIPAMAALRAPIDKLETLVDKRLWPVPTYGDLLFEV